MIQEKIIIPLLKSLITAILVALFAAAWFIGSIPWRLFFICLSGICLVSWLALVVPRSSLDRQRLIPKETTVRLELASDHGRRLQFIDLPISPEMLSKFAQGVTNGASLTEARWIGNGFTRTEFVNFRDSLIDRNLAEYRNPACPARGWVLTRSGLAAFRYLSESPTPDNGREAKIRSLG